MVQSETSKSVDTETALEDTERWLHMYEQMLRIRVFEEHVNILYTTAKMPGLAHLYIGEEAIAVGGVKPYVVMTTLQARTEDMDTALRKVPRLTLCMLSC